MAPTSLCVDGEALVPDAETRAFVCVDDGFCVQRAIRIATYDGAQTTVRWQLSDGTIIAAAHEVECPPMYMDAKCGNAAVPAPVPAPEPFDLVTANSATVRLNGKGTQASPLMACAILSPDAGNGLEARSNGLFTSLEVDLVEWGTNAKLGRIGRVL